MKVQGNRHFVAKESSSLPRRNIFWKYFLKSFCAVILYLTISLSFLLIFLHSYRVVTQGYPLKYEPSPFWLAACLANKALLNTISKVVVGRWLTWFFRPVEFLMFYWLIMFLKLVSSCSDILLHGHEYVGDIKLIHLPLYREL